MQKMSFLRIVMVDKKILEAYALLHSLRLLFLWWAGRAGNKTSLILNLPHQLDFTCHVIVMFKPRAIVP